jgi:hypothetical protein
MFYGYKMAPQRWTVDVWYYFFRYSELKFNKSENNKIFSSYIKLT